MLLAPTLVRHTTNDEKQENYKYSSVTLHIIDAQRLLHPVDYQIIEHSWQCAEI